MQQSDLRSILILLGSLVVAVPAPRADGQEGSVEVNSGFLADDAWRFGTISGVNQQGTAISVDGEFQSTPEDGGTDGRYWQLQATRLGLHTPQLEFEAGEFGVQRLNLQYKALSSYYFDDALTPILNAGSPGLDLPGNWQSGADTSGMTTLQENLSDLDL